MSNELKDHFLKALEDIDKDAKAAGSSITEICREEGIGRATPDRWRRSLPKTIELVTRMQAKARAKREAVENHHG